ncbi:MAG TPA: DUF4382 domain-containing protein [Steroidobacteraceae bacterium]|nr:DUF4382 domain-containing protein [Steroidobacteraceae bacterium]
MTSKTLRIHFIVAAAGALLAACGGSSGPMAPPTSAPQSANLSLLLSDASTEDWATIGVKVLSIALIPQGGGGNVTVYTAPADAPVTNLAQLDQLDELLGNASIPVGSYSGALLTLGANPGDISLTAAADPSPGFAAPPGATIPEAQIQVEHAQGSAPNRTVTTMLNFDAALAVDANQNNALDLEFDLGNPAFIVGHVSALTGTTIWAVNLDGPVRRHPRYDLARLVLRQMYGSVTAIATDASAITIDKEYPTEPVANPQETAVSTPQSLQILADSVNGTLFYDLDAKTHTVIKDFSAEASLVGKSVRITARYQQDGTLVAVRIWASSSFNSVWVSPEGHVLHVDTATDVVTIENESGGGVPVVVDANTQFYFRSPQDPAADAAPIATGTAFLAAHDLVRGFKVHAAVVDPLATPLVAASIDIETARYGGAISAPDTTGFTYTSTFRTAADDYVATLDYLSASTANGSDANGNPISGYKWWNFAYPTLLESGAKAIGDFVSATDGAVDFGGSVGALAARGASYAIWSDPANAAGWSAKATVLLPSRLPLGAVADGLANDAFTITVAGGTSAATIDVDSTAGSATLVYQVDRSNGIVTVSPIDITTAAGLATLTNALTAGTAVKVYGIPQTNGAVKTYVLLYFTGDQPAS